MKICIFKGSPNKLGFTNKLVERFKNEIDAEIVEFDAYRMKISACVDCKYCDKVYNDCCIKDDMAEVYKQIKDCDAILVASPIHVASVTAPLLAIFSRFQIYFATKFIHKKGIPLKPKKGYLFLTSGQKWEGHQKSVETIVKTSFLELNTKLREVIALSGTDNNNTDADVDSQIDKIIKDIYEVN